MTEMELRQKLLVTPGKIARKLKLEDRSPDYDGDKKKENVERDLVHLSSQMSELQYKLFADNSHLRSLLVCPCNR